MDLCLRKGPCLSEINPFRKNTISNKVVLSHYFISNEKSYNSVSVIAISVMVRDISENIMVLNTEKHPSDMYYCTIRYSSNQPYQNPPINSSTIILSVLQKVNPY